MIFSFLLFKSITTCLAEFDSILNCLTDESIHRAIACFQEGLSTRKVLHGHFDTRHAQMTCHSILRTTENGSIAKNTVINIPKFWVNISGLTQSSNLTTVETIMTRVFCMQGSLKFHYWLLHVVPAAINRTSKPNHQAKLWIDKLAVDVQTSLLLERDASFDSSDYLPDLPHVLTYKTTYTKTRRYDNQEKLASIMTAILRLWLHFPTEDSTVAQLTLLDIFLERSLTSILFLDKIWEMYKDPFGTVFSYDWEIRRSNTRIAMELGNFKKRFALHPFAIASSSSYLKLQDLSNIINEWIQFTSVAVVDSDTSEMVSQIDLAITILIDFK
jgi:hypothetical protein